MYDSEVRRRLKARGILMDNHCAKCGAPAQRGHTYCLGCATIRRLEGAYRKEVKRRARETLADVVAESLR
jgi:uncharacterized Zn finger protein (UPF0148 family)